MEMHAADRPPGSAAEIQAGPVDLFGPEDTEAPIVPPKPPVSVPTAPPDARDRTGQITMGGTGFEDIEKRGDMPLGEQLAVGALTMPLFGGGLPLRALGGGVSGGLEGLAESGDWRGAAKGAAKGAGFFAIPPSAWNRLAGAITGAGAGYGASKMGVPGAASHPVTSKIGRAHV